MRNTTVGEVMVTDVVTVAPDTPFKDIVETLVDKGISAVPVVDRHGVLRGVVSEADLLRKQEHEDDRTGPSLFAGPGTRREWRKAEGHCAQDLMTSPVLTVTAEAFLPTVARMLSAAGVRRAFVVEGDRLAGVIARRDLLREFTRSDADIQAEIQRLLYGPSVRANPAMTRITVTEGVVTLTGRLQYQADITLAVRLVDTVPGVVEIRNRLDYLWHGGEDPEDRDPTNGPVPPRG